jgi:hypothetical protein
MIRGRLRDEARVDASKALVFLARRSTPTEIARTLEMTMGALSGARPDPDARWGRA